MIDNLIPLVDFVLLENDINVIKNYANFIKQKPEKWMFFPCDEDGNYWKFPPTQQEFEWASNDSTEAIISFRQKEFAYKQAKKRVLFEHDHNDVDLFIYWLVSLEHISLHHLKLTETAKKMIYENSR